MSQVFGDSKRLVNDYMAASHAIGIRGITMYQTGDTIREILDEIQRNNLVLPAIQREFVWRPQQVCRLFSFMAFPNYVTFNSARGVDLGGRAQRGLPGCPAYGR